MRNCEQYTHKYMYVYLCIFAIKVILEKFKERGMSEQEKGIFVQERTCASAMGIVLS